MLYVNEMGFTEYTLIERSNGRNTFSFTCALELFSKFNLYDTVLIQGQKYIIDEFNSNGEELEVVGTTDMLALKGFEINPIKGSYSLSHLLGLCRLKATGYSSKEISIHFEGGTAYDLFKKIGENEHIGLKQVAPDTFYCHDFVAGKSRLPSILAHKRLNVLSLNYKEDVLEHYNEIVVYGKDGIRAVASTGETPKLIKVLKDERFSVLDALQAYADSLLLDHKKPIKSYEIELADLHKHSEIHKKVELFDNVSYLGEVSSGEVYTVWEIERSPLGDKVKLANRRMSFASFFDKYEEKMKQETDRVANEVQTMGIETNKRFTQVNGSIQGLNNTVRETRQEIDGTRTELSTRISQNAETIRLEANRLSSRVDSTVQDIASLEVKADRIVSTVASVENTAEAAYRKASIVEQTSERFAVKFDAYGQIIERFSVNGNGVAISNLYVSSFMVVSGNLSVGGSVSAYGFRDRSGRDHVPGG